MMAFLIIIFLFSFFLSYWRWLFFRSWSRRLCSKLVI